MRADLSRLFAYYRPYRSLLAADIGCATVVAAAGLASPLLIRAIAQTLPDAAPEAIAPTLWPIVAGLVALLIVQALCTYYYDYRGHTMGAMMERDMRQQLFEHIETLSFRFHDEHKPGELLSRLTGDLLNLAELCHHLPENVVVYGLKFIGAIAILLLLDWRLTLAALAFLPPLAFFAVRVGARMNRAMAHNLGRIAGVQDHIEENLSGIRVVQSFANERLEAMRFRRKNDGYFHSRRLIYRAEAHFSTGVLVIVQCVTIAVVACGGLFLARAAIGVPDLLAFVLYIAYLVDPLTRLAFMANQYQQGMAGFRRFQAMLAVEPDIRSAADAVPVSHVRGEVTFRDVSFRYKDDAPEVLRGVNLSVRAGETVALVGPSGVGKTTLCSLISRFYDPTRGAIYLDGLDLRRIAVPSLRRAVGVVQQDVYLFSGSVLENIRYGKPDATDDDVRRAAADANAHDFIVDLPEGYDTDVGHRGERLSGGQRQRIGIARAFLKNPPILILDEATSALDTRSEAYVRDALAALAQGRTTFIIAHRLTTIKNADRILVLSPSGIVEQGTHEQLIDAGGLYQMLYRGEATGSVGA